MASTATAQLVCAPRAEIIKKLADKYEEKQIAAGLETSGRLVEVFVSNDGSFTILLSYPNGHSCVGASGNGWRTTGLSIKR